MKTERHIGMSDIEGKWMDQDYPWFDGSYADLVEDFGTVVLSESFGTYQGDMFYIFKKDGRYGFLTIGYGSCSGCDALEACQSISDLYDLQASLRNDIVWFSTLEKLKFYVLSENTELQWYAHEDGWNDFALKVKNYE